MFDSIFLGLIAALALGVVCVVGTTLAVLASAVMLCRVAVKLRLLPAHLAKCTSNSELKDKIQNIPPYNHTEES
jgi:hypothetical protein